MDAARDPIHTQFSNRLAIETPEHVVVELELAGLGSRLAAVVLDTILVTGFLSVLGLAIAGLADIAGSRGAAWITWITAIGIVVGFLASWGYFLLFEALNGGRTPGKKALGIRTVMDTGHRVTFAAAAVRNLVRVVDSVPVVGLPLVLLHSHNKRLGDLVAGTIVVRERPSDLRVGAAAVTTAAAQAEALEAVPELSDAEYALLGRLLERLDDLDPPRRERLVQDIAARLAPRFPRRSPDAETFLVEVYGSELSRRRGRLATRAAAGVGGVGRTTMAAERFVARKQATWEDFRRLATGAERAGLVSLGPREIPAFAARYREVTADLARARTYGVDVRVTDYLERLVTAGHNAIYGLRGRRRWRVGVLLLRELPATVVREGAAVLLAFALFAVPAVAGYFVIRERPDAAYELISEDMIARAEAGVDEEAEGTGYAETPDLFLPVFATGIIARNVQVAFFAFAFGVTAGVGTIIVLFFNGFSIGMTLGLFANYGLADWLLTFVAGHRRPPAPGRARRAGPHGHPHGRRRCLSPRARRNHRGLPLGERRAARTKARGERKLCGATGLVPLEWLALRGGAQLKIGSR
jgi:uncharacterized RDD family membrane protein YckC